MEPTTEPAEPLTPLTQSKCEQQMEPQEAMDLKASCYFLKPLTAPEAEEPLEQTETQALTQSPAWMQP